MTLETLLLVVAGTLTSLLAGLFFSFSVAINGGLSVLKDSEYVRAMQSINRVILNPVFLLTFMGPVVLLPLVAFVHLANATQFTLLALAAAVYIVGSFGVTVVSNVPLNDKLEAFKTEGASDQTITAARTQFEKPWNRLHTVRTLAAIIATILVFAACAV